tara:strand:+ start:2587 stop:3204 length:618 start_codon:yes stop_codon:yes gene_type:complete
MRPYYEDAAVTIYHGDTREILPTLPPVDLVLTDPPYGIGANAMTLGSGKHKFHRGGAWDSEAPTEIVKALPSIAEECCIWGGNYFSHVLPVTNSWFVWHKLNDGLSFSEAEMAWSNYAPQVRVFSKYVANKVKVHPTEKPVDVMQWCLSYSETSGAILDPFMGSGTTLRAAKDLGRKAIGIEIEERYCEIAAKRMSQSVMAFDAV